MPFEATARIDDADQITGTKALDRAGKGIEGSGAWVKPKIDSSPLQSQKRVNAGVSEFQLRSGHAMKNAEVGTRQRHVPRTRVGESLGGHLVEVVGRLCSKPDFAIHGERQAPAAPPEGYVCLGITEIIGKDADLNMIGLLGKGSRYRNRGEHEQNNESFHFSLQSRIELAAPRATVGRLDGAGGLQRSRLI